jgi:hypothetical protein
LDQFRKASYLPTLSPYDPSSSKGICNSSFDHVANVDTSCLSNESSTESSESEDDCEQDKDSENSDFDSESETDDMQQSCHAGFVPSLATGLNISEQILNSNI